MALSSTSLPTAAPNVHPDKILATFLDMVRIDSPSGKEEPMRRYLEARLTRWGIPFRVDAAGNLMADIPSQQCDHTSRLIISAHMDVVPPCLGVKPRVETIDGEQWVTSDTTTVLGADDKAALAVIMDVLESALSTGSPLPTIRLILTTEEEVGLRGAKKVAAAELENCQFSLIFDHTGEQGVYIQEAPTLNTYTVSAHGISTHAGIAPEKGVNAITVLSQALANFPQGRLDEDTTTNMGTITGGKGTNVVPDAVTLTGEIRSHRPERIQEVLTQMRQALEDVAQATPNFGYELTSEEEFAHYRIDPNDPGIQLVEQAITQAGLTPQPIRTNGGSDNNIFIQKGVPGVVLSAGYVDPHSLHERVSVKDLIHCANIFSQTLQCFAKTAF